MSTDAIAIGALVTAASTLVPLIKFWMDIGAMKAKALSAEAQANGAIAKAEFIAQQFASYRAEVAEKYATIAALAGAEGRFTGAVEGMRADLRRMTDRLDRVLELGGRSAS